MDQASEIFPIIKCINDDSDSYVKKTSEKHLYLKISFFIIYLFNI